MLSVLQCAFWNINITNYATLCDKIIQHYAKLYNPRRYIASICRLVVVNVRFLGVNCPEFNWHIILHNIA